MAPHVYDPRATGRFDAIGIVITRDDVEAGSTANTLNAVRPFSGDAASWVRARNRFVVQFSGYDDDPREIFEIPEIRRFVAMLDQEFPFWLHGLSKAGDALMLPLLCLLDSCSAERTGSSMRIDFDLAEMQALLEQQLDATHARYASLQLPLYEYDRLAADLTAYFADRLPEEATPSFVLEPEDRDGPVFLHPIDASQVNVRCAGPSGETLQFNVGPQELTDLLGDFGELGLDADVTRQALVEVFEAGDHLDQARSWEVGSLVTGYLANYTAVGSANPIPNWWELHITSAESGGYDVRAFARYIS